MNLLFHPLHGVFHGEEAFSFEKAQLSQFFSLVVMTLVSDLGNCHLPVGSEDFFSRFLSSVFLTILFLMLILCHISPTNYIHLHFLLG